MLSHTTTSNHMKIPRRFTSSRHIHLNTLLLSTLGWSHLHLLDNCGLRVRVCVVFGNKFTSSGISCLFYCSSHNYYVLVNIVRWPADSATARIRTFSSCAFSFFLDLPTMGFRATIVASIDIAKMSSCRLYSIPATCKIA